MQNKGILDEWPVLDFQLLHILCSLLKVSKNFQVLIPVIKIKKAMQTEKLHDNLHQLELQQSIMAEK